MARTSSSPFDSLFRSRNVTAIGLISDTHGVLRKQALEALAGSDLILHAGDVGKPEILRALEALAPLLVVKGNVDNAPWARALPATAVAELGPVTKPRGKFSPFRTRKDSARCNILSWLQNQQPTAGHAETNACGDRSSAGRHSAQEPTEAALAAARISALESGEHVNIYMLHNLGELDIDLARAGFDIVVSGHSHQPSSRNRSGVLYVNPGSAGPRRFQLPVTVARLDLALRPWRVDFIDVG